MLCVRKYNYNCAHRLDYSTSLTHNKTQTQTKTQNANPSNTPLFSIALRIKPKLSNLLTLGHQVPASLSHHFSTEPASPIQSCLQFLSCLRLFSSSQSCLHHALCLECPSLNFRLAKTFLSFGDAAAASKNFVS